MLRAARDSGALTLAVTNAPDSPLAEAAELSVDIAAGHERAVAATKTYTAELLALLMLVEGDPGRRRRAAGRPSGRPSPRCPSWPRSTLADDTPAQLAPRYRFAAQLVTTGRGYAYPTAREAALKLMETSYLPALAFSGADLLHGPLAMTDPDVPVLAVVGSGPGGRSMREVLPRLGERRADVVVVGSAEVAGAPPRLAVPEVDERYAPLLDILPLQRLALALALARGEDPDAPRGLKKVTATACEDVTGAAAAWQACTVSTLRDLAEEHTALRPADIDHLHRIAGDWQLLSDLSFADLLLWVPVDDDEHASSAWPRSARPPRRPRTRTTRWGGSSAGRRWRTWRSPTGRAGSGGRATRSGTATCRPGTRRSRSGCAPPTARPAR